MYTKNSETKHLVDSKDDLFFQLTFVKGVFNPKENTGTEKMTDIGSLLQYDSLFKEVEDSDEEEKENNKDFANKKFDPPVCKNLNLRISPLSLDNSIEKLQVEEGCGNTNSLMVEIGLDKLSVSCIKFYRM